MFFKDSFIMDHVNDLAVNKLFEKFLKIAEKMEEGREGEREGER